MVAASVMALVLVVGADMGEIPGTGACYERELLRVMVLHRELGADMAELCSARAVHVELREQCEVMRETWAGDAAVLRSLQGKSVGSGGCPTGNLEVQLSVDHNPHCLAQSEGEAFDREVVVRMIAHLQTGMRATKGCAERATRDDVRKACADLTSDQAAQLHRFEAWRDAWFDEAELSEPGAPPCRRRPP